MGDAGSSSTAVSKREQAISAKQIKEIYSMDSIDNIQHRKFHFTKKCIRTQMTQAYPDKYFFTDLFNRQHSVL